MKYISFFSILLSTCLTFASESQKNLPRTQKNLSQQKKTSTPKKKPQRAVSQATSQAKQTTTMLSGLKLFLTNNECPKSTPDLKNETDKIILNQIYLHHYFKICKLQPELQQSLFPEIQKNYDKLSEFEKFIFKYEMADFENQIASLTPDQMDDFKTLQEKINYTSSALEQEKLLQQAITLATALKLEKELVTLRAQLAENSPRLFPEGKDPFLVAKDHRSNRGFKEAIQIYDQIISSPNTDPEKIYQALKEKRQTLKTQQKKLDVLIVDKAIVAQVNDQFIKAKTNKETASLELWQGRLVNDTLIAARALWTESRMSEGKTLAIEKMNIIGSDANLDEFYFLFAKMAEEKKDFAEALVNYQKINQKSSVYLRTLWASGWIYLRKKNFKQAHEQFESLLSSTEENSEKIKALFWSGQALKKSKKKDLALQKFREVETMDPYGYYGILAHRELKLKFQPLTSTKFPSLQKIFSEVDADKAATIQTLIDYKAKDYLEAGMRQFKDDVEKKITANKTSKAKKKKDTPKLASRNREISSDLDQDLRFGLIAAYSYAGLYLPLFQYMSSLAPEQKDSMLALYPQTLFPSDYVDLISQAAKRFHLDVALPMSIIRQESAFNPEARSHAEAYGLMQVLPEVAKQYKKRARVEFQDPQELFIPEINIPIGCAFLSDLMKKWNQRFIPAVASYNSSARAVNNWLLTRTKHDPLMFIEEIPYEETRGYVKLVLRNHIMYRRIIDQKSFSFPENFLIL